jgi:hypothetical protein
MRPSATIDFLPRARLVVVVALVSQLVHQRPATAQQAPAPQCNVPVFVDDLCADIADGGDVSIDDYKDCYGRLYDDTVIPAFRAMAQCTHAKAAHGIGMVLESAATLTLADVTSDLCDIARAVNPAITPSLCGPDEAGETTSTGLNTCIGNLNALEEALRQYIDAERNATDLDTYRRATYTPASFTYFTNLILAARQNRADCDGLLRSLRKALVPLGELRLAHPDYCEILRDSADYAKVSQIDALAEWTRVDPDIEFDWYFNVGITLGAQCGYYEIDQNGGVSIEHKTCRQYTAEYSQTLAGMDGALGWLTDNRDMIVAVGTAAAAMILSYAGYGASAGPYGALIGAAIGLLISGVHAIMLWRDTEALEDLIDDKEEELRDVVASSLITEEEFDEMIETRCPRWQAEVQRRFDTMIFLVDAPTHIDNIDQFFTLSDRLHGWYNELLLWATTPGPNGQRFITELARQELLAQKSAFDQRIFGARADQEVAAVRNELTAIKGAVTLLGCSNLGTTERRNRKRQINVAASRFNAACSSVTSAIAVQPDQPVAFADAAAERTVTCSYKGFRNGITSLEIRNGSGSASNMTLKSATGAVIAQLSNVSSETDFGQTGLPGFSCSSSLGGEFGTTAATRLAEATYPMRLQDNIFGLDESDASGLRSTIQTLDSQFRLKQSVCMRQLGAPVEIPRTAEACGLPAVQ